MVDRGKGQPQSAAASARLTALAPAMILAKLAQS